MAIFRRTPTCPKCGKPIAKGIYKNQSKLPPTQRVLGDTFIRWEYINHKCDAKPEKETNPKKETTIKKLLETTLVLQPITAYTINSADDEWKSSDKGVYQDKSIAEVKAIGSGWYKSNGTVKEKENVYKDQDGNLYTVTPLGKFTDAKPSKKDLIKAIKAKLTEAEIKLLNI